MSMERNERSIVPDLSYLEKFLRNLVLGEKNELKNRFLHVGFKAEDNSGSKSKNCTSNCSLEELAALRFLKRNPKATQEQIAKIFFVEHRTTRKLASDVLYMRNSRKMVLILKSGTPVHSEYYTMTSKKGLTTFKILSVFLSPHII